MTENDRRATTEGGKQAAFTPFFLLKIISGLMFLLSVAGMICAGLLFNDIQSAQAHFLPETWEVFLAEGGAPQGLHLGLTIAFALGTAVVAGMIYAFAAVAETLMRSR